MAIVVIDVDELYPYYSLASDDLFGHEVEVPDETLGRWRLVNDAWRGVQREMTAYYNGERT